MNFRFSIR